MDLRTATALWQTPSAQQFEAADLDRMLERQKEAKAKGKSGNGFGIPLANEVQIWARNHWSTPKASDPAKAGPNMRGSKGDVPLPAQAVNWPTPLAAASGEKVVPTSNQPGLIGAVFNFPYSHQGPPIPAGPTSSPERRTLNPLFVEWLMGWPIGWTASAPVETASSRWWQDMRGELLRLVSRQPVQGSLL